MAHQILRHKGNPFPRSHHRLKGGPFCAQVLFSRFFLPFGNLFKLGIDLWPLLFVEFYFCQASLVINGNRRLIFNGPQHVVRIDVIAEDGGRAPVVPFNRRGGKADEGCPGQGVVHVAGITVDKIVLAAVCLIGNNNDIFPIG